MTTDVDYEAMTPVQVEHHLNRLRVEIPKAVIALREARRAEVRARAAFKAERRRAVLSPDCPKPSRDGHTVAYRDAWVEEQAQNSEWTYDVARVSREAAEDHVRGLRDESMVLMALGRSVNTAYQMAGER
ncbi:hypothetical protein ACIODS_12475 [Micromonospora chalcea]|uniref:hypothetical protein n=1 Tax=Micromonospora chalcea TaxID=1874 RepID=UPI00380BF2E7